MLNILKKTKKAPSSSSAGARGGGPPPPVPAGATIRRGGSAPSPPSPSSSSSDEKGGVRTAKTEEDEEVELSASSQETAAAGSSPPQPKPRGLRKGGPEPAATDGGGVSVSEGGPGSPPDSEAGGGGRSKEEDAWPGRRRCYTILVGLIFLAGAALVVLTVTLFHKWGLRNGGSTSSSPASRPRDGQGPAPPPGPPANETAYSAEGEGEAGGGPPPSRHPTFPPTAWATEEPSWFPSEVPSSVPTSVYDFSTATFFAIGDVPYDELQATQLAVQIQNIPSYADFVVHVGDLRNASEDVPCGLDEFERVSSILRLSKVPVFVALGDNDWNDCPNHEEGLQYWKKEFLFFESRYWNHTFNISRLEGHDATFSFRHKRTLFIGLNLVGGKVLDWDEWRLRLRSQYNWTADLIREYRDDLWPSTGRVVIVGHADPTSDHDEYFNPLEAFVRDELGDTLPILYLHGDKHKWKYQPGYLDQSYLLRIMVAGGSSEPPLKLTVPSNGYLRPVDESFVYDRDLANLSLWDTLPSTR